MQSPSQSTANRLDVSAYAQAILIRTFEGRLLQLFSEGKLFGTVHTCIGQEFSGIAVANHLRDGDTVVSNHRCHGHYLARTGDVDGLMAEVMGRVTGICGGRGGSQHLCVPGFFSNGVQGGMMPVSAGLALAAKLAGTGSLVVTFIGDGTLGEGVVYETLNLASKWSLPLLVVCEDNGYSQSTPSSQTLSGDIRRRAEAFDIPTFHSNTWAPDELNGVVGTAIAQVRDCSHPAFVLVETYRLMAHSKGDDDRPMEERERYWALDPLTRFAADYPAEAEGLRLRAEDLVSSAVTKALAAPFASPDSAVSGLQSNSDSVSPSVPWTETLLEFGSPQRVVTRIHQALREHLSQDPRALFLGEDIEAPYGGAFKVTKDLSELWPGRVRNTPVSEATIVGVSNGLALAGMRPVCEIMFGDFLTLAADQIINHAAKFQWMYNGKVSVPQVIRTPMGGKRGYGPTHSQSIEKHFLGVPGTRVLALHHRYDPYAIYSQLFATIDRPTLVLENKILYREQVTHRTIAGFWCEHSGGLFPTTRIRSHTPPDITIVCYGGCLIDAEKALDILFEQHEVVAEIICPVQLYPLCVQPIAEAVMASRRLLVVEEGQAFCGFGAEVLASLHETCEGIQFTARRHAAAPHPIPASLPAEIQSLPSPNSIVNICLEMVRDA